MKGWRVFITSAAEKAVKRLPLEVQNFVLIEFPEIIRKNPFAGERLSGPLNWLRSFHFSINSKPYRIAYSVDSKTSKIFIHYAGHRGSFYERLRRVLHL